MLYDQIVKDNIQLTVIKWMIRFYELISSLCSVSSLLSWPSQGDAVFETVYSTSKCTFVERMVPIAVLPQLAWQTDNPYNYAGIFCRNGVFLNNEYH